MLLYDRAQPAPELSVFLLDSADHDWQQDAQGLYERMQAIEDRYKIHCGLQQLFTQRGYNGTLKENTAKWEAENRVPGLTARRRV